MFVNTLLISTLTKEYLLMNLKTNKRGSMGLNELAPAAIAFVFIAVVLAVGASILAGVQDGQTADSEAYNATGYGLEAVGELGTWLPLIALVIAAAVVIGVLSFFRR